jgi:MinD-like ATPase involved in chromosome partitioning or flagellar assembly
MAELVIGTVATPQPWRRELQAHVRDHVAGVRLMTLHDTSDALSADVDIVVVDDTLDFLTEGDAQALRDQGTRIVGVFDPSGRQGRGRRPLDDLKVETALPITAGPEALLDVVATLTPGRRDRLDGSVLDLGTPAVEDQTGRQGLVVAVSGGSDSPGRTEVAVALTRDLARHHGPESVVLVDLDQQNPTIARRLGFQLVPNVLDAEVAARAGQPLDHALGQRASFASDTPAPGFDVIAGVPSPGDSGGLEDPGGLLDALAARWPWVVLDVGSLSEPSNDRPSGAAHSVARSALRQADHVVAVAGPTPLGVLRLLDWAAATANLTSEMAKASGRYTIVVNRAPRDRFRRDELHHQLTENLPADHVNGITFLPEDRAVPDAVWNASPVGRGRFTTELATLARQFAGPPAGGNGHRPWRRWGRR